jgi:hypothetical protein
MICHRVCFLLVNVALPHKSCYLTYISFIFSFLICHGPKAVEAELEGRSGAGAKIEDERSATSATAMLYKKKYTNIQIHISTDSEK